MPSAAITKDEKEKKFCAVWIPSTSHPHTPPRQLCTTRAAASQAAGRHACKRWMILKMFLKKPCVAIGTKHMKHVGDVFRRYDCCCRCCCCTLLQYTSRDVFKEEFFCCFNCLHLSSHVSGDTRRYVSQWVSPPTPTPLSSCLDCYKWSQKLFQEKNKTEGIKLLRTRVCSGAAAAAARQGVSNSWNTEAKQTVWVSEQS